MGVLPDKGPGDSGADHPAVLIGGLGEEKHILRGAAPGGGVTPAQAAENDPPQVVHNPLETVPGDRAVPLAHHGNQSDMDGLSAASGQTRHGMADNAEEVILAHERPLTGQLLELFQQVATSLSSALWRSLHVATHRPLCFSHAKLSSCLVTEEDRLPLTIAVSSGSY